MTNKILEDVKKLLGVSPDYDAFDTDIIIHINSAFANLTSLGVGPVDGFEITGSDDTWDKFIEGRKQLSSIRTYIYLKVRIVFDPPTTSFHLKALEDQLAEYEWRIQVESERLRGKS